MNPRKDIMEFDWDTLFILDACRYDMFKLIKSIGHMDKDIPGKLDKHISKGSNTAEFLTKNFNDSPYNDTVYYTANPTVSNVIDNTEDNHNFHALIPLWYDLWDDEIETVPPEDMVKPIMEAHDKYSDKRIIFHLAQPHMPFVGDLGRHFTKSDEFKNYIKTTKTGKTFEVDAKLAIKWRTSYFENLQLAIALSIECSNRINGKIVITSDHGERLGEVPKNYQRGDTIALFGHTDNADDNSLRHVPWLEIDGKRREIKEDEPQFHISKRDSKEQQAEEKLKALGYI